MVKQGWIHGYPSRVRVSRGRIWGHLITWAGAVWPKTAKTKKRKVWRTDQWTDGRTDGPTKQVVESRSTRLKIGPMELLVLALAINCCLTCNRRNSGQGCKGECWRFRALLTLYFYLVCRFSKGAPNLAPYLDAGSRNRYLEWKRLARSWLL